MNTMTTQTFQTSIVEAEVLTQGGLASLGQIVEASRPTTSNSQTPETPAPICLLVIVDQEKLTNIRHDTMVQMLGMARVEIVSTSCAENRPSQSETSTDQRGALTELHHQPWIESLSERESEILRLIDAGLSNRAIAERLMIAVSTVKRHLSNIYGKLGVHSRTQAIVRGRQFNLL